MILKGYAECVKAERRDRAELEAPKRRPPVGQLVEGVDDSEFRAKTRQRLLERGNLTSQQLDGLFPDLPPSGPPDSTPK